MKIDLVARAIRFAAEAHAGQYRKGSHVPYITHPMEAALIMLQMGGSPEYVAAALLHDTVEDTSVTPEQIRAEFGEEVARLVSGETCDKACTWEECKQAILDSIKAAPREEQLLTLSDKLANIRSMAYDYAQQGDELWSRFKRGYDKQKWYYISLKDAFSALDDVEEYLEFTALVDSVFEK